MGKLSVYSFSRVSAIVAGIPVVGFWDGDDPIKITPAVDSVSSLVGADGEAIVSISLDLSAIIEFKLKPDSPSNALFTGLEVAFRKAPRGIPFPIAISNFQNLEIDTAPECVILQRTPEKTFGKSATARVWRIFAASLTTATLGQV